MRLRTTTLDWKLGGRMLVKYPGLTVIGGLTLAVAIAIGVSWFEITRQMLNPRLPLEDGDRIVRIDNWDAATSNVESRSVYDFQLWREQLSTITELGAYRTFERNLSTAEGSVLPTRIAEISATAFPLARVPAMLGRTLLASDAEPGAPDVVVIGYDVWQSQFEGARDVLGRTVRLGRTPATIVGVMPEDFRFPVDQQAWVPLRLASAAPREGQSIRVIGRLAGGASHESAQTELTTIGQRIAAMNPTTHAQLRPHVLPYAAPDIGSRGSGLVRLSNIIAWLILAVAASNVATLMFARTATREAEIVVRNALGASRARVMMQLLVEAFVLCAVAAIVGLVLAGFALEYGLRFWVQDEGRVPFWLRFSVRPLTVVYAATLALGGAALLGLLPALKATGPRVQRALTQMSTGTSLRFGGVWSVMIVLQVAFAALCLPMGFAAAFWTLHDRASRSPLPAHEYLTFRPELDADAVLATGEARPAAYRAHVLRIYDELKRQLEREPSVTAVTYSNGLPGTYFPLQQVEVQRGNDAPFLVDANIEGDRVRTAAIDIGFFDAFRYPLIAGRAFHPGDITAENTVIINETLAQNIGGNPVGVRVRFAARGRDAASPWWEVAGVVRDVGMQSPRPDFLYQPKALTDVAPLSIAIHVRGNATAFAPRLRAIAMNVEPGLRLYDLLSLDEVVHRREQPEFYGMIAILAITLLIAALSAAGLYALMSVAVTRRTREVGIRLAIGANPRAVVSALFTRAAIQVGIGIVLAVAVIPSLMTALGISELRLNEVLIAMLVAAGGMLTVALVACGIPARRALRIQATEAMRYTG